MNKNIFREKAIKRIQSPESIYEYVRVVNPGMWIILCSIIVFLAGGLYWCITANLYTNIDAAVVVSDGQARCYVFFDFQDEIREGLPVYIEGNEYLIEKTEINVVKLDSIDDQEVLLMRLMKRKEEETVCYCKVYDFACDMEDGEYSAFVTVDSVKPIDFILEAH